MKVKKMVSLLLSSVVLLTTLCAQPVRAEEAVGIEKQSVTNEACEDGVADSVSVNALYNDAINLQDISAAEADEGGKALSEAIAAYKAGTASRLTAEEWNSVGSRGDNCWVDCNNSLTPADVKAAAVTDDSYGKALRIETYKKGEGNYHGQIFFKLTGKVCTGDNLFYAFRMKGLSSESADEAVTNMRIRPSNGGDAAVNYQRNDIKEPIDDDWTLVWGYADAPANSADSSSVDSNGNKYGAFVLQVGMAAESFEIADLQIYNLSRTTGEEDEPEPELERLSFEEAMKLYNSGKGTLVNFPSLDSEGAYDVELQEPLEDNDSDFVSSIVDVSGQSFDKALYVKTTRTGDQAWDAQVFFNLDHNKAIQKGDTLFYGCRIRGISSVTNKEAMFVAANTRIRPDRKTSANFDITASINADDENAWTLVYGACEAPAASTDLDGAWVFHLGGAVQELMIGDIFVIDFGKDISVKEMPVMSRSYLGMEEDAQWRKDAYQRIEEIRKQDLSVEVTDSKGNPIKDAAVKVEQQRHAFGFGTIVNVDEYNKWDSAKQEKYKAAFEQIAHNRVGFENALKPYYVTDPDRQVLINDWMDYFEDRDLDIRGHVLIYGDDTRLRKVDMSGASTDMEDKALFTSGTEEGNAALRDWTMDHIDTYVEKYKGRIYNWDVVNENMTSHDWADRLSSYPADSPYYSFDSVAAWFDRARAADPDCKLTYNDYGILSRDKGHQDYHYELCKYLSENSPLTTIGIQGHISLISPIEIINILDRFSGLGKDIEITEFTYEDDDPEFQARFTRDFMIAVFSEEAVSSITTWGFYQGCMYQPKAAMVDSDFNLKPNGQVWHDMIYNEWWTNEEGATDIDGIYSIRAFKGTQKVTVTACGEEYEYEVELGDEPVVINVTTGSDPADPGEDIPEEPEKKDNTILVGKKDITIVSSSVRTQTLKLNASSDAANLTYESSDSKAKVDANGIVTIPRNYSGNFTVTIRSEETDEYKAAEPATVTVTVKKQTSCDKDRIDKKIEIIEKRVEIVVRSIIKILSGILSQRLTR
ncbi:endo-1,4-beta-xylanase [Butyrivibrio sp. MC2013]|uniref:endo-1,4-beta-xylanase n=1 Tax=Butyrivibrio sp. MC2013 TaxID=1280686 RepID=UPI0003FC2CDC|nr:endo-1,4-beta-xylanase [Butyrivibrio sp. MC2013]